MNENKRFTIDFDNHRIIDNEKNEYLKYLAQFKEILNNFNDKNGELKKENQAIQRKVFKLMDWLETEKGLNRDEIKEWWND